MSPIVIFWICLKIISLVFFKKRLYRLTHYMNHLTARTEFGVVYFQEDKRSKVGS
jgi:uncharacterized membrane protein